jgi:hypothetical protein
VRFREGGPEGFLGPGKKHFLVPAEAVGEVEEDGVVLDQDREKVADSSPLDTGVVPQPPRQREVYD